MNGSHQINMDSSGREVYGSHWVMGIDRVFREHQTLIMADDSDFTRIDCELMNGSFCKAINGYSRRILRTWFCGLLLVG
ncbi:hypothetical protein CEXT_191111 [Caerostris extrusa]|uniref:Uncharacterized protein n=1 Tax=Caerostris extrusa TaxID=172846 RepID=A0AAV4QAG4_CAEEX|nr:hypothetical protein CEXT_191111 [Caerostris extrusa]